MKQETQKN